MILRAAAVLASAALVGCAAPARDAPQSAAKRDCFQLAAVSGYSHARDNQVYVHAGPGDTYLFRTLGSCPDLGWSEAIALDPASAGTICSGIDVDLIVPSTIGPRRCAVSMIRKLAPDERPTR